MSYRLGVDVGGTFTDLLLVNEKTGALHTAKVPSTPEDSSIGVFNGINRVCAQNDVDPSEINTVMHGTTVATNTILTETGVDLKHIVENSEWLESKLGRAVPAMVPKAGIFPENAEINMQ